GFTQGLPPHVGLVVWKKKSGLANIVNVGVRAGSAFTMCSAFSSTGSARRSVSGTVVPPLTYGSVAVSAATSRSSPRTDASVRAGDVAERDGHAGLLHLGHVPQRVAREHAVEAREAAVARRIGDGRAGRVVHTGVAAGDCRIDVLGPVQRLEAGVAAGFVGKRVGLGVRVALADAAADGAVNRD